MASTVTPSFTSESTAIRPDLARLIDDLGTTCRFPPEVIASARMLLAQVKYPATLSRGSHALVSATCLCVAARYAHYLFSLTDLARAAHTDRPTINRLAIRLQKKLGLRRPPPDLRVLVPQICESLDLQAETRDEAY